MELYFPGFVKNHSQISVLGCLESVGNRKSVYLEKKGTHKKIFNLQDKFSTCKN